MHQQYGGGSVLYSKRLPTFINSKMGVTNIDALMKRHTNRERFTLHFTEALAQNRHYNAVPAT